MGCNTISDTVDGFSDVASPVPLMASQIWVFGFWDAVKDLGVLSTTVDFAHLSHFCSLSLSL